MAGSCGGVPSSEEVLATSSTFKSFMSLPRNMINSYVSLLGGMCFGTGRPSVPKERTEEEGEREEKE